MKDSINIWKPVGLTPFEMINSFKERYPEYSKQTISYAGRLDPMAEGILILLVGEENKNRDKYLGFDKEYEAEIILGISTDTYDSLGKIRKVIDKEISNKKIENKLNQFIGIKKQIYPPYSSKTVNGKPLFWWARNKKISEIKIPSRKIEIYAIDLLAVSLIDSKNLSKQIIKNIKKLKGDFRQKEIIKEWEKLEKEYGNQEFKKIKIRVSCSSGTYVRRLAQELGKNLKIGGFAVSIKRTKIGRIKREDCLILF